MPLERIVYKNREDWLAGRMNGIGASEVSAAIGISPFMTNYELWEIKTGRKIAKDLSGIACVEFGKDAEKFIRGIFELENPQYKMEYHEFDILYQTDIPFIRSTLDGELIEIATGRRGIWECKTAACSKKIQLDEWKDKIPMHYYTQVLAQYIATGYEFATLSAKIKMLNGNSLLNHYETERVDCASDIDWLKEKLERFWWHVINDKNPPMILQEPAGRLVQ